MIDREKLLQEFLESIDEPVIVEGRKDCEALKALGVDNVVQLNWGGSLLDTIEALQGHSSIILLTDLDQNGKILRKKLLGLMNLYGIRENKKPREIFAKMRFSHVEALKNME